MFSIPNIAIGKKSKTFHQMANVNILIIEDDVSFALDLEMMIEALDYPAPTIVDNAKDALREIRKKIPDLIITDIYLKGKINGIQLAQKIKNFNVPIIFITSYDSPELYNKAREVLPYAYLPKPFDNRTLQSSIDLALARVQQEERAVPEKEVIYVKSNYQLKKVKLNDILYLNSDGNYCMIQTHNKKYVMKISLTKIKAYLPEERFVQIHKSYLVQLSQIDSVDTSQNKVVIDDSELPLGRKYKKELLERLNPFL